MGNYRIPIWIASFLGCVLIVLVALLSFHQLQIIRGEQLLNVSATAKVEAIPNLAVVTLGVVSEGSTAQEVKDQSSSKMNQVLSFIKQNGIADKDIKTSQFNISPKYDYSNQQQKVVGYQANQTITLKLRSVDKSTQQLEKIVDGVVTHGANQIQGIDFSIDDNESLVQTARKQAIDKAKTNAMQIARDAGLKLGRVVNVITSDSGNPAPIFAANFALAKAASPQVELGTQEVATTVTVVFEIVN